MEKLTDKLFTVKYNEDTGKAHIEIVDQEVCATKCEGKVLHPLLPGRRLRVERGAEEDAGQLRQLHRVRRLLHRVPF